MKRSDHITPAYIELHWLPIEQRIAYKICLLVHKSLNGQAPPYLSELLKPISSISSRATLRSASTTQLNVPRTTLQFGNRAFSIAGPRYWNALPADLRAITDITNFKRLLKAHFFVMLLTLSNFNSYSIQLHRWSFFTILISFLFTM